MPEAGRARSRRVRAVILALALAALACQALQPDSPTPVQPNYHPPQPITATPAPGPTATITPDTSVSIVGSTTPPGPPPTDTPAVPPTQAAPAGANYQAQSGDTLLALALRFRVGLDAVLQANPGLPQYQAIAPGRWLTIPAGATLKNTFDTPLLPDSAVVLAPSVQGFDAQGFIQSKPGFLATYSEVVTTTEPAWTAGQIVADYAQRYSINPRLLLALLELQSQALSNPNPGPLLHDHPLDVIGPDMLPGLSHQLGWVTNQLNYGFYGWQDGSVLTFGLADGVVRAGDGQLNAGTFAVARVLGLLYKSSDFEQVTGPQGLAAVYQKLFGAAALADVPLIPGGLTQPEMQLPFEPARPWAFTGGPHPGYGTTLPWAALDFAPPAQQPGCVQSPEWDVAVRDGQVTYSRDGLLELDVGGGWAVDYLHIATLDRAPVGTAVKAGDHLGHPSCEGGEATASHLHISRRYNGEWIAADGFTPFVLSGWTAHSSGQAYVGTLTKGDQVIRSCSCAIASTRLQLP